MEADHTYGTSPVQMVPMSKHSYSSSGLSSASSSADSKVIIPSEHQEIIKPVSVKLEDCLLKVVLDSLML